MTGGGGGVKKWILFGLGGRLPSPTSPEAERLSAILRHNLDLLHNGSGPPRTRDLATEAELEAMRAELTESYATIAALVEDLNLARLRVEALEERLADYEDGKLIPFPRGSCSP